MHDSAIPQNMETPLIRPEALKPGDTIAVIAPAGPIENRDNLYRSAASLESLGFRVRLNDRIYSSTRYLAGPDEDRAEELMHTFEDPDVHAIVALRGGYGCSRLIPLLQPERLRHRCKIFMGFSDLTTLHLYFRRHFGWITFHGPVAMSAALADPESDQMSHLLRLWTDPSYLPALSFPQMETWTRGSSEGELLGGCLSLIAASLATPCEPRTENKLLFLEDLGEQPYRLDRMLTQLLLAGKLQQLAGVLLGNFQDCDPPGEAREAEATLREIVEKLDVPVIVHFPAGHGPENWVLPLGARVRLDTASCTVSLLEPCVVSTR